MLVALLALVGAFVALYLTLYKIGVIGVLACNIGSCETVNTSRWATFLGLPVAAWGLGTYIVILVLALAGMQGVAPRETSWLTALITGWGVLFSAWLTYLELFVIHAICMWCVISATLMLLLFVTSVFDLRQELREG
ncbi:MAG TPA: vitamin K epoxide reductase family protein [Gemmatimonadaceae bacterium]|nr:vitamin K epoxide reductase family protein [Gemmatimonadaceae bacterium]